VLGPFQSSNSRVGAARQVAYLLRLPPRVAWFYLRAVRIAIATGDRRSLGGSTRPRELAALLRAARGRTQIVEIGTGTAWTSIALALSDGRRRIETYDPLDYTERHRYLDLLNDATRDRIELVAGRGDQPREDASPELVFIDSSHERDETMQTFSIWASRLAPGGAIAFHDYNDPAWPGVTQAVEDLGLSGETHGYLFVWSARSPTAALRPRPR
jgi:SAM-dependent methyltransferase